MPSASPLVMPVEGQPLEYRHAAQLIGRDLGVDGWGSPVSHVSFSSSSEYAHTLRNRGSGGHLNVLKSTDGASVFRVTDTETVALALSVTNLTAVTATFTTLTVHGDLQANGGVSLGNAPGDVITITGTATFNAAATFASTLTANSTVNLGNDNTDAITVIGVTTFRNAANSATQLFVDAANNRVIVGSGSTLGSETTPNLQVIGRLYVAPESANDTAFQIRRSSAATVGWTMGVENSPVNLAFKDDSTTKIITFGDAAATYQLDVTGQARITNGLLVSANGINVTGASTFSTNVTLSAGVLSTPGLSVTTNGASIVGGLNLDGGGGLIFLATNVFTVGSTPRTLAGHVLTNINGSSVYLAYYS